MNRFTGHKSLGTWMYMDSKGVWHTLTVDELQNKDDIIWTNCEGAGDFYWPHTELNNKLVPMQYDEERTI